MSDSCLLRIVTCWSLAIVIVSSIIAAEHQLAVEAIYFTPPGNIPKTSSGKTRHGECRRRLLAGELKILYADMQDAAEADRKPASSQPTQMSRDSLQTYLRACIADLLGCSQEQVTNQARLSDLGFNPDHASGLREQLRDDFGLNPPLTLPFDYPTLVELSQRVSELIRQNPPKPMPDQAQVLENLSVDELAAQLAAKLRQFGK